MHLFNRKFRKLFNTAPDGAGPGGPAGGGTPPPAASPAAPTPGSAPAAPPSGGPGAGAGSGGDGARPATPPGFTFAEDRSNWLPPYRLQETQQQYERRIEKMEQKVRALMGIEAPADPRREQLRSAFLEMFPEMQSLVNGELHGAVQGSQASENAYWRRHASTMTGSAVDALAKELGQNAKDMGPKARARMAGELQRFIAEDTSGERNARYEEGDPTLIEELIADIRGFYVEPVRRSTTVTGAAAVERTRRLPSQGPSGGVPPTPPADKPKAGKALHEGARQDFLARLAAGR